MFLYPWEIEDAEQFEKEYIKTGCNGIAPALSYHHGAVFSAGQGKVYGIEQAAVSFTPEKSRYGLLQPAVHTAAAKAGVVYNLRGNSIKQKRQFAGWVVLLHNSTLGEQYPECTVQNMMGQRYSSCLCPSNPLVREYSTALLEDICTQLAPDSLLVESATQLPAMHGGHHEIANIRITPAIRWLLSLCFCPHCMQAAAKAGGNPDVAKAQAAMLLRKLSNSENWFEENGISQLAMLLLEYPQLYYYQQGKQASVTSFVEMVSSVLRKNDTQFRFMPSSVPFEVNNVFMEGTSFSGVEGKADMLFPLVYGPGETYGTVRENIRIGGNSAPVGMAMTLLPGRYKDKGAFMGAVAEAVENGCRCIYFYNYSLASQQRLGWVEEAGQLAKRIAQESRKG